MTAGAPPTDGLRVVTIDTPSLGDRSYVLHDGEVAVVVDPQRDVDRVHAVLDAEGVRVTHVVETHVHNDYLTGGLALARATGATYLLNGADDVAFERTGLADGDEVLVGDRMRLRALATPGHTFTHLSYVVEDLADAGSAGTPAPALFSGGSLLYGATGRPDLLGAEHTDALVRHQHASAARLVRELPAHTRLYPTHGFGSFCSATQSSADSSTLEVERRTNPVLTSDLETYARELLAGLGSWPAYYARMAPRNRAGVEAPDLSLPPLADAADVARAVAAGEWVVDLRERTAFARGHLPGVVGFGVDGPLATYLGWLLPPDAPVTLLGASPEQVALAQRELVRIGIDRPARYAAGDVVTGAGATASYRTATFADLADALDGGVTVLDVRRAEERAAGHVRGSLHVPLPELRERLDEVPCGREVWVHCAGGYRAAAAASILQAAGRRVVAVDDGFDAAAATDLPLTA